MFYWPVFNLCLTRLGFHNHNSPDLPLEDAILALRLLADLHREFERPLNVAYLDIKAAFDSDSVDRTGLWKA